MIAARRLPTWALALDCDFLGGGVADRSPYANAQTLQNGASVTEVLSLDGLNDYMSSPDADGLDLPSAFSVSVWFQPVSPPPSDRCIIGKYGTANRSYQLWASFNGGYWQAIVTRDGALTSPYLNYRWAATVPTTGWHHLAWVVDTNAAGTGVRMKLYVDNVALSASTIFSDSSGFTPQNNSLGLIVGAFEGVTGTWKGNFGPIKIYRRAISDYDVHAIYVGGRS